MKNVRIRSFSGPNAEKYGPEKLQIRTLFMQYVITKHFKLNIASTITQTAKYDHSNRDPNEDYSVLSDAFLKLVDRHTPLKMKIQRGYHAPFISKDMRKAIYTRSRLRNKFRKNPSEENEKKYKRQWNLCVSLRRKR